MKTAQSKLPNLNVYRSESGSYRCRILSMNINQFNYQITSFQFLQEYKTENPAEALHHFSELID
ncbi:MAG: hypothetical protein QY330_00755 [Candidatus Dojkabacteria bacterium]|uniref:Uncharacterized protein n=2 Tax=Candidatus Dojkabacteria TaxID=74243 RepID=A0A136KH62_9BACT|nr:MAG: hypothetical protein UZ20_WS6002000749 [candidate division WS6 bacterium OLB21]MBW7953715.1 hypothetical protein [Candidatus Dojkabacteria bacterium]WKZ28124.1 MAG: hypothetical protein QY330_00755 [Candidatus Dojkabacteria bacterium]